MRSCLAAGRVDDRGRRIDGGPRPTLQHGGDFADDFAGYGVHLYRIAH